MSDSAEGRNIHDRPNGMGKTLGDLIDILLTDRRKGRFFLFLATFLSAIFMVLVSVIFVHSPRWFGVERSELKIGPFESSVLFESVHGNTKTYLTIVHPQGWRSCPAFS